MVLNQLARTIQEEKKNRNEKEKNFSYQGTLSEIAADNELTCRG